MEQRRDRSITKAHSETEKETDEREAEMHKQKQRTQFEERTKLKTENINKGPHRVKQPGGVSYLLLFGLLTGLGLGLVLVTMDGDST